MSSSGREKLRTGVLATALMVVLLVWAVGCNLSDPAQSPANQFDESDADLDVNGDVGGEDTDPEPTCDDGILNGEETDIDCGGPDCEPCELGATCEDHSDCESQLCDQGQCAELLCDEGECGGPDCPPCEAGEECDEASDCISGVCEGEICQAPTCDDGVLNGGETDIDCGGPDCPSCEEGQSCGGNNDCGANLICLDGECVCHEGRNIDDICADESAQCGQVVDVCGEPVDCGTCSGDDVCEDNLCVGCTGDSDCADGVCDLDTQVCVECASDGDCDGCRSCSESGFCVSDDDLCDGCEICSSGSCVDDDDSCDNGVCSGSVCYECLTDGDCSDGVCSSNQCVACTSDSHCPDGVCSNNQCVECVNDGQCEDGICSNNFCIDVDCTTDSDCGADICELPGSCDSTGSNVCTGEQVYTCTEFSCVNNECQSDTETYYQDCDLPQGTSCEDSGILCIVGQQRECDGSGSCACVNIGECNMDGDCPGGVCNDDFECVECEADGDCSSGVCSNNECVDCVSDSDCGMGFCSIGDCDTGGTLGGCTGEQTTTCTSYSCESNQCVSDTSTSTSSCNLPQGTSCLANCPGGEPAYCDGSGGCVCGGGLPDECSSPGDCSGADSCCYDTVQERNVCTSNPDQNMLCMM